mmetsp:Transcript_59179/g.175885  ORF Transcript_59179/g.175885 Transcript_59179/m.175885 type:complete len:301 (-) Transcript_59179:1065-1967(-)
MRTTNPLRRLVKIQIPLVFAAIATGQFRLSAGFSHNNNNIKNPRKIWSSSRESPCFVPRLDKKAPTHTGIVAASPSALALSAGVVNPLSVVGKSIAPLTGAIGSTAAGVPVMIKRALILLFSAYLLLSKRYRRVLWPGSGPDASVSEPLPPSSMGCPFIGTNLFGGTKEHGAFAAVARMAKKIGQPQALPDVHVRDAPRRRFGRGCHPVRAGERIRGRRHQHHGDDRQFREGFWRRVDSVRGGQADACVSAPIGRRGHEPRRPEGGGSFHPGRGGSTSRQDTRTRGRGGKNRGRRDGLHC